MLITGLLLMDLHGVYVSICTDSEPWSVVRYLLWRGKTTSEMRYGEAVTETLVDEAN